MYRTVYCVFFVLCVSATAVIAGNCNFEPGGIGGTGRTIRDGGIGGTGHETGGGGIGGTGIQDEGGIGGTGRTSGDGGIGGTGDLADGDTIGILGTVTEFASICVNGVEIHFDPRTPVQVDGQRTTHKTLAIGQVVRVVAKSAGNRLIAQNIQVEHTLSGPISSIDTAQRRIRVLGQTIQIGRRSVVTDGVRKVPVDINTLSNGQFVKISGLRRPNGTVMASRIEGATRTDPLRLVGRVSARNGSVVTIGGTTVNLRGPAAVSQVRKGNVVSIQGTLVNGQINARIVDIKSAVPFGGAVSRVNVEGYLERGPDNSSLRIGRTDVSISDQTKFSGGDRSLIKTGQHARVIGRLTKQGRIEAEGIAFEGRFDNSRGFPSGTNSGSDDKGANGSGLSGNSGHGSERSQRTDRSDRSDRSERSERATRPSRPARAMRPERPARVSRPNRPQRIDRPNRSGRN